MAFYEQSSHKISPALRVAPYWTLHSLKKILCACSVVKLKPMLSIYSKNTEIGLFRKHMGLILLAVHAKSNYVIAVKLFLGVRRNMSMYRPAQGVCVRLICGEMPPLPPRPQLAG